MLYQLINNSTENRGVHLGTFLLAMQWIYNEQTYSNNQGGGCLCFQHILISQLHNAVTSVIMKATLASNPGFPFRILSHNFGEKSDSIFHQSCETKSETENLGSRLSNSAWVGFGSGTETSISVVYSYLHFYVFLVSLWYNTFWQYLR